MLTDPGSGDEAGVCVMGTQMMPKIDPDALYTEEQAARKLMEAEPGTSLKEAQRIIRKAIDDGKLKVAGYLASK